MPDEFDDDLPAAGAHVTAEPARRRPLARLVSRLYLSARAPARARMLAAMLRPLSPLGVAAIAAGAFAGFLSREGGLRIAIDDAARYTDDQIFELAHFVEQVSPDALLQVARLVTERPADVTAFGLSVALLILRSLRRHSADSG